MLNPARPASLAATTASEASTRIRALFAALGRRLAASRRAAAHRHAAARMLREIEPRLLRDIGLTEADLYRAIHDA